MHASGGNVGACAAPGGAADGGSDAATGNGGVASDGGASPLVIGNHTAVYEGRGFLVPWTSWADALGREMSWYATTCGTVSGFPVYATAVHLDSTCMPSEDDAIPAMQDGMGILSYLKYYVNGGRQDAAVLAVARSLGDYLLEDAVSPTGPGIAYPGFPRSTGEAEAVPQTAACGSEGDGPYQLEPDKGGIAGHALMALAAETGDTTYSDAALHIAQVLVTNMAAGDEGHTPWPFRVDYRTGAPDGPISADLSYILRLFDDLIPTHPELAAPRATLWAYIKDVQIPDAACDGHLWAQFFEDFGLTVNRNAWSPLNLVGYLVEQRTSLDPDWQADARTLLDFVSRSFLITTDGFQVCTEQDFDKRPYGGILSTYGGVLAMYAQAVGTTAERLRAYQSLTILLYSIGDSGCPSDLAFAGGCGGWQEDDHLDKIHNYMDAIGAFPDWAN